MIEARYLSKWYGRFAAVDAATFVIAPGRVAGFLGPNGAGKSTTLKMLSGFLPPTTGTALVAGYDIRDQSIEVRRRIGYLPESTPLYPEMRVIEYLRFRGRLFGLHGKAARGSVERAIERCWLTDVRRKPIAHLSKGYRQRVGLAAALLHSPPVLLLDEPTSGLDPTQIREMRHLIRSLAGDHTVFLSTHILSEAELTCDEVVVIARGRIRAAGPVADLRGRAAETICYVVETDAPDPPAAWRGLPGVEQIDEGPSEPGWRRYALRIRASSGDLRERIAEPLRAGEHRMRELTRENPSLEQLFVRLISEDGPAVVAPRAAERAA